MNIKLAVPSYCESCSPISEADNILSPLERFIYCTAFKYCPYCGRELPRNINDKNNTNTTEDK